MIKKFGDVVMIQLSDIDSNIYVIGDTVIDAGTGFNFTRLKDFLKTMKKKLEDFNEVINTHAHFDHVGGNGFFFDAKISIHEDDSGVLESGDEEISLAAFFDGKLKPRQVNRKLRDGDKVKAGSMELEVLHCPGHTPGSICLYDKKSKTLFSGDTVFSDGIGRTDTPGGDHAAMNETLSKLAGLDVDRIFPGHGSPVLTNGKKVIADLAKMGAQPTDDDDESLIGRPV
ncbi:MAG: MBL fold metallo-hydrolase [Candidatus Aenigmatarchaeota archaeon]|nr:MAG: MBL fold metallo-hydrolase [Candidatus Aenigmarchaeota archaeon]